MKKLLSIILAVILALALGALAEDGKITSTGVGQGIDGDVKVQVVADATTIYSVEVLEQNETPGIGSVAVEQLPGQIVEANSILVDSISGATVTSNAWTCPCSKWSRRPRRSPRRRPRRSIATW